MSDDTPGAPIEVSAEQRASLITYPSLIAVKAMGLVEPAPASDGAGDDVPSFQALVESLVLPLIEPAAPERIDNRLSSGGKYVSISVHFTVTSPGQLEAIYTALHAEPRVLFTL